MLDDIKAMLEDKGRAPIFMADYDAIILKLAAAIDVLQAPAPVISASASKLAADTSLSSTNSTDPFIPLAGKNGN